MSGSFYDFDNDDSFDEVYTDKFAKKPIRKEYEITIPSSEVSSGLKSSMPQKKPARKKKEMSSGVKAAYGFGMLFSFVLVFLLSLMVTLIAMPDVGADKESETGAAKQVTETFDENGNLRDDEGQLVTEPSSDILDIIPDGGNDEELIEAMEEEADEEREIAPLENEASENNSDNDGDTSDSGEDKAPNENDENSSEPSGGSSVISVP